MERFINVDSITRLMEGKREVKELDALFREVEEHKKDSGYREALEDTHKYLTRKENRKLVLAE